MPPTKRLTHEIVRISISSLMLLVCVSAALPLLTHAQSPSSGTTGISSPTPNNQTGASSGGSSSCSNTAGGQTIANPLKFCSLEQVLDAILTAAIKLGTVVLTLALIWTGFKFVAARGNEEKISQARTALLWTVIGGLILLGAKAIELVISSTVSSLTP